LNNKKKKQKLCAKGRKGKKTATFETLLAWTKKRSFFLLANGQQIKKIVVQQ
jgi:hypothetical protein